MTAAIGISVSLNLLLRRVNKLTPAVKSLIQRFVPLPAVMTASTLNVVLMRYAIKGQEFFKISS